MIDNKTCGFYFIAFGRLHELYALAAITKLRRYSKLPIVLATNLRTKHRDPRWSKITKLTVQHYKIKNITTR